jgi:hypothetical protein
MTWSMKANLGKLDEQRDEMLDLLRNSGPSVTLAAIGRALQDYRRELRAAGEHDAARTLCRAAAAVAAASKKLAKEGQ